MGYNLAKALIDEGHEILLTERDAARSATIIEELGSACVRGDGCEVTTLASIGTSRADMLIAVTGDDEDNLVTCQVAKYKFKVPHTIARINNPKNEPIFKTLGIEDTISSTNVILEYIREEVPTHPLTHLLTIKDKGLEIVEVKIPPGSKTIGKKIKKLPIPAGGILSLLIRKGEEPITPTADTRLAAEDQIIAVTSPESEEALRTALRGS